MTGTKTDPKLLDALTKSAGKKLSAEELHEQKISFILGSLREDSTITRDFIESELKNREGEAA